MIPIHGNYSAVSDWLNEKEMPLLEHQPCYVFSENSFPAGANDLAEYLTSGAWISWLGGSGLSGIAWPRTNTGAPLAHVATFCLSDALTHQETSNSWEDHLPLPTGFLEIYHDLETYGIEADDKNRSAWLVRLVPDNDAKCLLEAPSDLPSPSTDQCQLGLFMHGFNFPHFSDSRVPVDFDRWEEILLDLEDSWHKQRFEESTDYPIPFTQLGGYSWHGKSAVQETLNQVLPISGDDTQLLLCSIESWTALSGWFGDAGTLEVWIRQSDLEARDFSQAWCIIRTD